MMQSFLMRDEYKTRKYENILVPVQFSEGLVVGYNAEGREIKQDTKSLGAQELIRLLQAKQVALSEVDNEGISELERITKQKTMAGNDRYFVLSETGNGQAKSDHIFASFLCMAIMLREVTNFKKKKKLGKAVA